MAARRNALVQRAAADVQSLPAPVGGWNARDSLANMEPTDAVVLENMFPTVSSVVLRGGYTKWATGMAGQVQTIMIYSGGNTTEVFAITSGGALYDVTVTGPVGAPILTGFLSGKWEYTNISTSGGNFLMAVNGADYALLYDGTSWSSITSVSTPIAITGVDTRDLHNIVLFKNRIWFIQKETLKAWYLPTSSVGGAAEQFSLQSVARDGGYLVDLDAWTIDAGYGVDDNLAFVTDSGEVIIYRGTDPASDATWALIGVWKLGAPVGERCMLKWGGDLLILTYDGLVPMAASLQSSRLDPRVSLSNKIQGAITAATTAYGSAPVGWEIVYNAKTNALWINVPVAVGSQQQYVMNTITKSWCNFTGWSANCWAIVNNDPYFGSNGYVGKAWDDTYADDDTNIATNTLQAFNYFGSRGVKKYFTRARASIFTDGIPEIFVGMNVDFDTANTTAPLAFIPSATGLWDIGYWDDAIWGAGNIITNTWLGITGIGYCGGIQMVTGSQQTQIEWASTDVVYQSGWAGV